MESGNAKGILTWTLVTIQSFTRLLEFPDLGLFEAVAKNNGRRLYYR